MTPKEPSCPYLDKECPKLEDVRTLAETNQSQLTNVLKILYCIMGMICIEWGVSIWL